MVEKLTKKQLSKIVKFRKNNPKKETSHKRRSRFLKERPWWISD